MTTNDMTVVFPSDAILDLLRVASYRVVLAAPYIKSPTLRRLLDAVPEAVSECICVTRWLPEDIASGVCDLEILDDIERIRNARLQVHPHLHAKYYSNGRDALVGSANLTARGLGWRTPSNVELLVKLPSDTPGLVEWEHMLLSSTISATQELREQIRAQAEQLEQAGTFHHAPEVEVVATEEDGATVWVPRCPDPRRLWDVYRGRGADTMVSSALEAAQKDLAALSPPLGLTQELFKTYVAGILRQMPLLTEIDKLAATGLTDAEAHGLLAKRLNAKDDQEQHWRVTKEWLVYFFPDTYLVETGPETLVKGRQLPER